MWNITAFTDMINQKTISCRYILHWILILHNQIFSRCRLQQVFCASQVHHSILQSSSVERSDVHLKLYMYSLSIGVREGTRLSQRHDTQLHKTLCSCTDFTICTLLNWLITMQLHIHVIENVNCVSNCATTYPHFLTGKSYTE